jgi:hypothetical protein
MPKFRIITKNSTVQCCHGGRVTWSSAKKLTILRSSVLTLADSAGAKVTDCGTTEAKPCEKVKGLSVGVATKLTVGKSQVLLETLVGLTDGGALKVTEVEHDKATAL